MCFSRPTLPLLSRARAAVQRSHGLPRAVAAPASTTTCSPVAAGSVRAYSVTNWRRPKVGWLKLNFDGSSKHDESRSASIGGVYRDHKGKFVLCYAGRIGEATSSVAEHVALKRGLELALENGWRDISVEGDFKTAIDAVVSRAHVRAKKDAERCKAITAMLPRLGNVTVTHVTRKGNKVADRFAKLGHEETAQRVWHDAPPAEVLLHLQRRVPSKNKKKNEEKKKKKQQQQQRDCRGKLALPAQNN